MAIRKDQDVRTETSHRQSVQRLKSADVSGMDRVEQALRAIYDSKTFAERCENIERAMAMGVDIHVIRDLLDSIE
ncbi:MAG: hypothetical protein KDB14_22445 [Planctomycetales bacterium]|nr:hypothetical protein [Planctomycetales bacterium]